MNNKSIILFGVIILSIASINALGCCLDQNSGMCTQNVDSSTCLKQGGLFSNSPTCSGQSDCDKGCCSLGSKVLFTTRKECSILKRIFGFENFAFEIGDEKTCAQLKTSQKNGACIYEEDCIISTQSECSGAKFYEQLSCTNPNLNTTCKKTEHTYCFEGDVYSLDSCGNPDELLEDCDDTLGTICLNNEPKCKSLDCGVIDGEERVSGDKWCTGPALTSGAVEECNPNIFLYKTSENFCKTEGGEKQGVDRIVVRWPKIYYDKYKDELKNAKTIIGSHELKFYTFDCGKASYEKCRVNGNNIKYPVNAELVLDGKVIAKQEITQSAMKLKMNKSREQAEEDIKESEFTKATGNMILGKSGDKSWFPIPNEVKVIYYTSKGYEIEFKMSSCKDKWSDGKIIGPYPARKEYSFDANKLIKQNSGSSGKVLFLNKSHGVKIIWDPFIGENIGKKAEVYEDGWSEELDKKVYAVYKSIPLSDGESILGELANVKTIVESYATAQECLAEENEHSTSANVGSESASKFCLYGEVIQVNCNTKRAEVCTNSKGSCTINLWPSCLGAKNKKNCPEEYCYWLEGINYANTTSRCMPIVAGGNQFWFSENSFSGESEADSICEQGSFKTSAQFYSKEKLEVLFPYFESNSPIQQSSLNQDHIISMIQTIRKFLQVIQSLKDNPLSEVIYGPFKDNLNRFTGEFLGWELNRYCIDKTKEGCKYFNAEEWKISKKLNAQETMQEKQDFLKTRAEVISAYNTGKWHKVDTPFGPRIVPEIKPEVLAYLQEKCKSLGDCNGKVNYKLVNGNSIDANWSISKLNDKVDDEVKTKFEGAKDFWEFVAKDVGIRYTLYLKYKPTIEFSFDCSAWEAPSGDSDCDKCGEDGACSEYKCKSLGAQCEYNEIDGIDKGFCFSSKDKSAPTILSHNLSENPVRPYYPVKIDINTDTESFCKFSLNEVYKTYEDMPYNFGENWAKDHSIKLNLPGQTEPKLDIILNQSVDSYSLITREGKYKMYVRCMDYAENKMTSQYMIEFEVMQYPDDIPVIFLGANPVSGGLIKFNTTEKETEISITEPAECRWDFEDKKYENLTYELECEETQNNAAVIRGNYRCIANFTNVTLNLNSQTKYFIRCKDQPQLNNDSVYINNVLYKRNTNDKSYEYILRPSEKLSFTDISPNGKVVKRPGERNMTLMLTTSGGAESGKAKCQFKHSPNNKTSSPWIDFSNTDSYKHTQFFTNVYYGKNYFEFICKDSAENEEGLDYELDFQIDEVPPSIIYAYHSDKNLKIKTDESSICYYSFNEKEKCNFDIVNSSKFTGEDKEHKATWHYDKNYYIKCIDSYGNSNTGCMIIARTY
jgi:hypothetical protein